MACSIMAFTNFCQVFANDNYSNIDTHGIALLNDEPHIVKTDEKASCDVFEGCYDFTTKQFTDPANLFYVNANGYNFGIYLITQNGDTFYHAEMAYEKKYIPVMLYQKQKGISNNEIGDKFHYDNLPSDIKKKYPYMMIRDFGTYAKDWYPNENKYGDEVIVPTVTLSSEPCKIVLQKNGTHNVMCGDTLTYHYRIHSNDWISDPMDSPPNFNSLTKVTLSTNYTVQEIGLDNKPTGNVLNPKPNGLGGEVGKPKPVEPDKPDKPVEPDKPPVDCDKDPSNPSCHIDSGGDSGGGILGGIKDFFAGLFGGISAILNAIKDGILGLGKFIVDGIVKFLQLILDALKGIADMLKNVLTFLFVPSDDTFKDFSSKLQNTVSEKLFGSKNGMSDLQNFIDVLNRTIVVGGTTPHDITTTFMGHTVSLITFPQFLYQIRETIRTLLAIFFTYGMAKYNIKKVYKLIRKDNLEEGE